MNEREQTLEERNMYHEVEQGRMISEMQKMKSDIEMLKNTIVKLVMKMVGETE